MIIGIAGALGLVLAVFRWFWLRARSASVHAVERYAPGDGLRWWPVAAVCVGIQLWLVSDQAMALPGDGRLMALWTTNAALAVVLALNLRVPGMRLLLAGMALNFCVMAANGGLMPVSPETLLRGGHGSSLARTPIGQPMRRSKDVLLREEETQLALLSDRIVLPMGRGSFSVGDVLIAAGMVVGLYGAAGSSLRAGRVLPAESRPTLLGAPAVT